MRNSTIKLLGKFADILIENTPVDQITKTKKQMVDELKLHWKQKGASGQKFIHDVVNGTIAGWIDTE